MLGCHSLVTPPPIPTCQLPTFIAKVLDTIAFVWATSKHYNTPSRIIVILQEFSNQLIEMVTPPVPLALAGQDLVVTIWQHPCLLPGARAVPCPADSPAGGRRTGRQKEGLGNQASARCFRGSWAPSGSLDGALLLSLLPHLRSFGYPAAHLQLCKQCQQP